MDAAKPPLPTPRYLPFQPAIGNQTSKSMFESLEGRIAPCTRQNAGSFLNSACCAAVGVLSGPENSPAGTIRAIVMEVSGSFKPAMLSHVPANKMHGSEVAAKRKAGSSDLHFISVLTWPPLPRIPLPVLHAGFRPRRSCSRDM